MADKKSGGSFDPAFVTFVCIILAGAIVVGATIWQYLIKL